MLYRVKFFLCAILLFQTCKSYAQESTCKTCKEVTVVCGLCPTGALGCVYNNSCTMYLNKTSCQVADINTDLCKTYNSKSCTFPLSKFNIDCGAYAQKLVKLGYSKDQISAYVYACSILIHEVVHLKDPYCYKVDPTVPESSPACKESIATKKTWLAHYQAADKVCTPLLSNPGGITDPKLLDICFGKNGLCQRVEDYALPYIFERCMCDKIKLSNNSCVGKPECDTCSKLCQAGIVEGFYPRGCKVNVPSLGYYYRYRLINGKYYWMRERDVTKRCNEITNGKDSHDCLALAWPTTTVKTLGSFDTGLPNFKPEELAYCPINPVANDPVREPAPVENPVLPIPVLTTRPGASPTIVAQDPTFTY